MRLTRALWRRCLAGLALIWSVQGANAQGAGPDHAQIVRAINAFDLAGASRLLDERQQTRGADAPGLYYRTRVAVLTGDLDEGAAIARRCLDAWPEHALCHEAAGEAALVGLIVEGNILKQLGASRRARKHLERAVALDPDNLRARVLLVRFYSLAPWFAGGSRAKALEQVEACRARDPSWGHEAAALLALSENRYDEAIAGFRKASELRPEDRDPSFYLAKAYSLAGETEAAIGVLETLVSRYPQFYDAWLELGEIAAARGLPSPRGAAALEHFLTTSPEAPPAKRAEAALTLARLHEAAGRVEPAGSAYAAAREAQPESRAVRRSISGFCRKHEASEVCSR